MSIDTSPEALAKVTKTLAVTAEGYDRSGEFPWEGIQAVHDAGLLRLGIGEQYGGRPVGTVELARVVQALGHGDASVALISAMTIAQHLLQAKSGVWPDELYRKAVEDSLDRPVLINAIRAEPELGAPARGGLPATTVTRTKTGWLLNGHKGFGTGSEGLSYHAVWAATEEGEPLLGHVYVPAGTPGIEIVKTWDHHGLRASSTHDIRYTNVEVPAENFRGLPAARASNEAKLFAGLGGAIAALYVGVARAAQEFFVRFAHERVPTALGKPIATTERIQTVAGEIEAQLIQAEEVIYGLSSRLDDGDLDAVARTPVVKLLATRAAITAVQTAVAALGNPGLTRHHPLERHLRDVLCSRVHPPQDDTALLIAGRQSLARTP